MVGRGAFSNPDTNIRKQPAHDLHTAFQETNPCAQPQVWSAMVRRAMIQSPVYEELLARVLKGEKLLDLAYGFGQNIRRPFIEDAESDGLSAFDMVSDLSRPGTISLQIEATPGRNSLPETCSTSRRTPRF